ncbi:transposase [Nitrobacter sp. NHB1]|uniref:transposase n=1 Tax=Nitrobacter sp. NHB1 TaxID=3119830 RepID=UPI003FA5A6FA
MPLQVSQRMRLSSTFAAGASSTRGEAPIVESPSTKKKIQKRAPEMRSSKKGNQWYFDMKAHIGIDTTSGLVHTAGVTTGSVHDAKVMDMCGRIWTPPDCNRLDGSGSQVTTADVYPAS